MIMKNPKTNSNKEIITAVNSGYGIPAAAIVSSMMALFFSTKTLLNPVVKKNNPIEILLKNRII